MTSPIKLIFLVISLISSLTGQAQKDYNQEWLDTDIQNLIDLTKAINNNVFTLSSLQANIPKLKIQEQALLWPGIRTEMVLYGGYTSIWMTACRTRDNIYLLKIEFTPEDSQLLMELSESNTTVRHILQSWPFEKVQDREGNLRFQYTYENQETRKKILEATGQYLGKLTEVSIIDTNLKNAYTLLMDPLENLPYGANCSGYHIAPKGREAIEILLINQRLDLIRNVAKGLNPGGRAYALEALLRMYDYNEETMPKEDQELLEKLIELPEPVRDCVGCLMDWNTYLHFYNQLKKKHKDSN